MHNLIGLWSALHHRPALLAALVFASGLAVYVPTLAPGLLWGGGDFALYQTRLYTGEGIYGGAFGHGLWVIVSRPFLWLPIGDVAYRANLAAATYASMALVFVCLSARLLTRATAPALLATGCLLVSHTFWTYAVMPKVYSLNALLLGAALYCLLQWERCGRGVHLYLFTVIFPLSLLNHLVMATAAIGCIAYVVLVDYRERVSPQRRRQLLFGSAIFLASLVPFGLVTVGSGHSTTTGMVIGAFVRGFVHVLTEPVTVLMTLGLGGGLLVYQFPLSCAVGAVGLRRMWRFQPTASVLLLLIVLGNVTFLLGAADPRTGGEYIWNLHYYLQTYVVFALWIAAGVAVIQPYLGHNPLRWAGLVVGALGVPVMIYAVAPAMARPFVADVPAFRELPGRDNLTYVLSPWKHTETGPQALVDRILQALPPGSVLCADYSIKSMLDYAQIVQGARPDVTVVLIPGGDASTQMAVIWLIGMLLTCSSPTQAVTIRLRPFASTSGSYPMGRYSVWCPSHRRARGLKALRHSVAAVSAAEG